MTVKQQKPASQLRRRLSLAVNIALFAVAIVVVRHILTEYKFAEIVSSLHRIGWPYIWASFALTVLGYGALVGYDYLSLRIAGHPIGLRRMWSASFISHAVQNSAPVAIVAGGGLRYRLFSRLGITGTETAAVVAGNVLTFVLGLLAVAGVTFILSPVAIPPRFHLPFTSLRPLGVIFLLLVVAAFVSSKFGTGKIRIGRKSFDLPRGEMLRSQLAVSIADWLLSSAALYVLLRASGPVSYWTFLSGYLLVEIVTQVVPLPGGVGVFEAAMLLLRPPGLTAPFETAALLVYRVVYFLVPLVAASTILAIDASRKKSHDTTPAVRLAREITPHLFAVLTFIAGVTLLAFNTVPGQSHGFQWLGDLLRLAVVEGSQFLGSLVGMGLLLLAFGLERQLRSAFNLTVGLLVLGILSALLRSLDIVSAGLLFALLLLLVTARREFDRKIPFSEEPMNAGWVAAVVVAVVGIGWFGIYTQVAHQYSSSLWWRFALDQDVPRTLRVTISTLAGALIFVVARLVSRARRRHAG